MYLLNNRTIEKCISDRACGNNSILDIKHFEPQNLEHTFYYFRLGAKYKDRLSNNWHELTDEGRILKIPGNSYFTIRSLERFETSNQVLGIMGQSTDLIKYGLILVHSPYIDPVYNGPLVLGIHNPLPEEVSLELGQTLGKVSFFNISDTYPIVTRESSMYTEKLDIRSKLTEAGVPLSLDQEGAQNMLRDQE